ncbi:MAG: phosphatase PAP2 family protein [Bacteroidales bacterium]|nr:phosphatase PAP2 family protein [Bacteroidales bacterium]MBQ9309621.1 phosphatase PAP2 family protein [Bacteroidales bacterium]
MKSRITIIIATLLLCQCAFAQQTYFSTDELPDLIKCLPAPPEKGSAAFKNDVKRYRWGKQQRKNAELAEMAKGDAVWTYEALLGQLSPAFGMAISKETTPEIWELMDASLRTVDQMRVAPKAYYHRIRPFEYFKEETLTGEDPWLKGEGSYPSGHTIRSWLSALILAEINPARANEIYARAWAYGDSRVIAGAHWQSDVDQSRVAAGIGYAALQVSEEFRAQMEKAKDEFRKLAPAPSNCHKDN